MNSLEEKMGGKNGKKEAKRRGKNQLIKALEVKEDEISTTENTKKNL